ncbi:MAG: hypothetical protein P8Z35_04175, partial [Ignavibacteriaceae bacterium]
KGYTASLPISNIIKTDSSKYVVSSVKMGIKPDSGSLAFEVIRTSDKGVSSNHENFITEKFNTDSLDLSDVILATKVIKDSENTYPLQRNGIGILPNPTSVFSGRNDLYLYYEIYNLEVNVDSLTDFDQRITIKQVNKQNGLQKTINSVLSLIGINKNKDGITLSSKYQTADKNTQMYIQLDMNNAGPGEYKIVVNIFDNISKKEVSKSTQIWWN